MNQFIRFLNLKKYSKNIFRLKNMWKLIYEILVNPLGLPINPIWEYLIISR